MPEQVLGLINPGMSLIFAVGALILWLRDRGKRYLLGFVLAPLAIGVSLSINHFTPNPEALLPRVGMHTFSLLASISFAWAACTRLGKSTPLKTWLATAVFVGILNAIAVSVESFAASLFVVNAACGIVFVMAAQLLAQAGSRAIVDRVLVWLFALIAAQFFVRPVVVIMMEGAMTATEYRESVGYAILTASAAIMTLLLASAVLAAVLSDQIRDLQLRSQSDALTGLPLRRGFEERVERTLGESEEVETPLSLILADIDHFKQVNDIWGHQVGDRAIATFGELIARTIRNTDHAGRIGGEEFCVLVWDCTAREAEGLAERLRKSWAAMAHEGISEDVRLTASFGVTAINRGEGYARAFSRADQALYEAKEAGRDRVVVAGERRGRSVEPIHASGRDLEERVTSAA
ncbi:diguanylate cyclase [Erythrobacter sp. GH1-10]|uniref:diguanylate cyclase n=1 Tax=Erythrobacter sp. GH1-10 TaxID=3349334 RepID=UPI003877CDEE